MAPALGPPRLRHHGRAVGCHPKMLSRHSHAPRRRREGGPCVVSWCAAQPPAAACLAAWRPGSLLQRTPRRPRRGRAPCCTGLAACTSARRRNRGGTGDGEGRQPAPASERQQHHAPARLWMSPPPRIDLLASTPRPKETSQRKHSARRRYLGREEQEAPHPRISASIWPKLARSKANLSQLHSLVT